MKISRQLAFCGLTSALIVITLLASLFPYADIALAATAGVFLIPVALELGTRYAVASYFVSSALSFFIVPSQEAKWLFILFFGFYAFVKIRLDLWFHRTFSYIVKCLIFNLSAVVYAGIHFFLIGIPQDSLLSEKLWLIAPLIVVANIVFLIYDFALIKVIAWYRVAFHPILKRFFR